MPLCEHQVRERAYYIWEDEGRGFGRAEIHWLQAEAELSRTVAASAEVVAEAAPAKAAKVSKPRAAKSAIRTPVDALAGVTEAAKSPAARAAVKPAKVAAKAATKSADAAGAKAPAKTAAKAAAKTAAKAAAPKAASRAKARTAAEGVSLH
ncbi:DUF2934 domain-containing protein [Methylorubrum salsuginis]|uniref:DUF2934 domain-containing protein n=1 Tax=Methylorubrum salsuginis TaxID=414703 RepID=A0A1I3YBK0_9HYPH|nr:DUF2934 domain-containing protein [Methylorubrum salsuginis]SFK29347.1 Protein of unknown function [Methylorubrum salsuginis]